MFSSPFIVGRVVHPDEFVNRRQEIRRAVSLILTGQSLAFTGEPRIGKSSLLSYLESQRDLYGKAVERMVLVSIDAQSLEDDFTLANFWERVLDPLVERLKSQAPDSPLLDFHRRCREEGYRTYGLEQLLARLQQAGWQLVLLLDEFDTLLDHPRLHSTEFYGGLRSLASRYGTALTLVLASRHSITTLNERTASFTRTGSPFFNFVHELPLRPFSQKDADAILDRAGGRCTSDERQLIHQLTGGHPYLVQVAGDVLWNAYEEGLSSEERPVYLTGEVLRIADGNLRDTWKHWSGAMRTVFTIIALDDAPALLGEQHTFDLKALFKALDSYPREIRYLREQGYIRPAEAPRWRKRSGYSVAARVMLLWLAETLLKALEHEGDELGALLSSKEWLGTTLKRGQLEKLRKAVNKLGALAQGGVEAFIKALGEGMARGIAGG